MPEGIGVIGLGAMGLPMALNLYHAGLLAGVWNRSEARRADFARQCSAPVVDTPEVLAQSCDCILTCVSADEDLLQIVEVLQPAMSPGSVLVDTSTVSSASARTVAARLQARGIGFVDAPVSGGVEGARNASLSIMAGGEHRHLEQVRPYLEVLGARITHMGPVGAGQATKAVNQIMVAGINQAVTEALAFAEAQKLPLDRVIEVVGGGAAANWFLNHRGPTMVRDTYAPGFRVALHAKDLSIVHDMADALGVALPVVEMTLVHYRRLIEQGFGDEDISALFRQKRELFRHDGNE